MPDDVVCENKISTSVKELIKIENEDIIKDIGPKTSKNLNIDTDAKFRFERGIDQLSIENGLNKAAILIKEICGGEISKIDIQKIESNKK